MGPLKEFTKLLIQFLSTSQNRLSAELIDRTKLLLLDYLGAYSAGQKTEASRVLVTLEGKRSRNNILSAADSAFRYGVAAHALEMDDAHRFACVHPGSVVFSTALSLGDLLGSSGRDVISSVVAGYEAICYRDHNGPRGENGQKSGSSQGGSRKLSFME
jgi:2-methylcitrate dehydratase PrpD